MSQKYNDTDFHNFLIRQIDNEYKTNISKAL